MILIDGIKILMILKKVTGTLVTLKRLASVQEQRIHPGAPIGITRIGVCLLFRADDLFVVCHYHHHHFLNEAPQ